MNLIVHTDGASRGNPGPAAAGFIISDSTGKIIAQSGKFLGTTTNNQAEYRAVLLALTWIQNKCQTFAADKKKKSDICQTNQITFYLDSELVVRQLSGQYKIKSQELLPLAIKIKSIQNSLNSQNAQIVFRSIPRSLNKPADRLVNRVLDSQLI